MSTSLPVDGHRLDQISPKAYEHPADRAATAALASVPYLDQVVRKLIELGYERAYRQRFLGGAVRISEEQLPAVHTLHRACYVTLDLPETPDLYVSFLDAQLNALAVGSKAPFVVISSGARALLEGEELRAVFAHEAGHILSDHQLYRTALGILLSLTLSGPVNLPLLPVKLALLEWSRASELTCDRAAALVTRDPMAVCRALMAITAGVPARDLNVDAFLRQSADYTERGSGLERLSRLLTDLNVTHALPVRRVKELMDWVRSGEYDRIVSGDYRRRGDDPTTPREEAGDATAFYAERFKDAFAQAGESVGEAGQKLSEWLRGPAKDA